MHLVLINHTIKNGHVASLVVQFLRHGVSTAGGTDSIPYQGSKFL